MAGIGWIHIGYTALASVAFLRLSLRTAVLLTYLAGWLLLPVGAYPAGTSGFTIELIGSALPSSMLLTKAWAAPVAALALGVLADRRRLRDWRPGWIDLPMLLWCFCPALRGFVVGDTVPVPPVATAYLLGTWGAPWMIGRLFFSDERARVTLLRGLAIAALMLAPAALLEWSAGPVLHGRLYGPHPFVADGADRYVGYRPILLFEHGNQYGMWIAMAALGAVAVARMRAGPGERALAASLVGMALLSQSVGAIVLLALGWAALGLRRHAARVRPVLVGAAALVAVAAPVYASGVIPVERLVRGTPTGQRVLELIRSTGRGSIAWRVSQDQKVAPLIRERPVIGAGRWDWWRPAEARPWGLAMLVLGQFGLVGLALAGLSLLLPVARLWTGTEPAGSAAWALGLIAALSAVDALLNAFVFLPAIAMAGSVAARGRDDAEKS